ncbi:heavy-metal-associated domain-containing protein [Natronomonas sp. EA1]|uniref:heavy-metal-associated domain-containing protein n=1 Tax=Natronomonas sp. EA1 TaxID=3421655 RepID=UPI003EB9F47F
MTTTLTVSGMSCGHCESAVEEALLGVSGVSSVDADNESDTVTVEGNVDVSALVKAVEDVGYEASA